ncbi:unnamed protein product [Allacma fusca]|uniref:Uncharacterized protein n=1 Tax=Allacma fusca TaxID=39272 RepID=A0A8J2KHZ8_9HEXA|nr:unnamed protein product [Allacma fusca]
MGDVPLAYIVRRSCQVDGVRSAFNSVLFRLNAIVQKKTKSTKTKLPVKVTWYKASTPTEHLRALLAQSETPKGKPESEKTEGRNQREVRKFPTLENFPLKGAPGSRRYFTSEDFPSSPKSSSKCLFPLENSIYFQYPPLISPALSP